MSATVSPLSLSHGTDLKACIIATLHARLLAALSSHSAATGSKLKYIIEVTSRRVWRGPRPGVERSEYTACIQNKKREGEFKAMGRAFDVSLICHHLHRS